MKPHPHAEVLRAIADGVPLSEFEYRHTSWKEGEYSENSLSALTNFMLSEEHNDRYKFRRKPKHIMVNGFKVPKPLEVMPTNRMFWPDVTYNSYWDSASYGNDRAKVSFYRGVAHATKEAAIAHAKAMLGIDPEYFK